MAKLTIRQMSPRDLPALSRVGQLVEDVDLAGSASSGRGLINHLIAAVTPRERGYRMFVALIDGELCAYCAIEPDRDRFAWNLIRLAAGSPRLDAHDSEVVELWSSLLEFSIMRAGEAEAKRLFADVGEGTLAHESLARAGFEGFTTRATLVSEYTSKEPSSIRGIRPQEPSDVWSIHHLYHRVTPRSVQFAEARTSAGWELPRRSMRSRLPVTGSRDQAYVYETANGIEAYCRCSRAGASYRLDILADPASDLHIGEFTLEAARLAGVATGAPMWTTAPGYAQEISGLLEAVGFRVCDERIAMVRHTTAPAAIHVRLAPLPAVEAVERAVRGIPTYSHVPHPVSTAARARTRRLFDHRFHRAGHRVPADRTVNVLPTQGLEHSTS